MLILFGMGQQFKNPFHTPWLHAIFLLKIFSGGDNYVGSLTPYFSCSEYFLRIFFLVRNTSVVFIIQCFVKEAKLVFFPY